LNKSPDKNEIANNAKSNKNNNNSEKNNPNTGKSNINQNNIEANNNSKNLNYFDIMSLNQKKAEKVLTIKKQEKEKETLKECTFKPKINSNSVKMNESSKKDSKKRIDQLYKIGKTILTNKKDKTKDEIEAEKNQKECTFKPNIEKKRVKFQQFK